MVRDGVDDVENGDDDGGDGCRWTGCDGCPADGGNDCESCIWSRRINFVMLTICWLIYNSTLVLMGDWALLQESSATILP